MTEPGANVDPWRADGPRAERFAVALSEFAPCDLAYLIDMRLVTEWPLEVTRRGYVVMRQHGGRLPRMDPNAVREVHIDTLPYSPTSDS